MSTPYPDIEGQLYTTGAPDATYTEAEARQRAATAREVEAAAGAAGASALASAKAYTDQKVTGFATTAAMQAGDALTLSNAKAYTDAQLAGFSGNGVETVSGTVTLNVADGVFRQVYATGTATVQTEPLAAGQVAIFRHFAGAWQVRVMNADGSVKDAVWRAPGAPDTRTGVIAAGPTWQDDTAKGGGTWTTPTQTGVVYSPPSGTATPGQQVTVTAASSDGTKYRLDGTTSWTHAFPADPNGPLSITETFDGPAGTLVAGKTTTTGGKVFAAGAPPTNLVMSKSLVLSGAGAAVLDPADAATNAGVRINDLPASPLEATLTYANHTGASVLRLGIQQAGEVGMALIYARSIGKVEVYQRAPWTKLAEPVVAADAGTLRIRRTDTAFEAYAGDTLLHTMPAAQGTGGHMVGIALQGGATTQITDLSVKAV